MINLLEHNGRVTDDIERADNTIGKIELQILIKIGMMYLTIILLGLAIILVILSKIFF